MRRLIGFLLRTIGILLILLVVITIIAAFLPFPMDELPPPEEYGAGASSVESSLTGLQREFPPLNEPLDNPTTPEKAELGRQLFFDPILSEQNDISCATCHHPDYGFSDGLPRAIGAGGDGAGPEREGGTELPRNTLTLWNVGYNLSLFWDGRVEMLEYQALVPLSHSDEMAVINTNTLVDELRGNSKYVGLFQAAFGGDEASVTLEHVTAAIAAFERTLISQDSPFDRYAAGDLTALTASQRRGLDLFRSAATRCFECHSAPTFASDTFRIIGVPDVEGFPHDSGRAAVIADGADGAFKVPTLRNIALTAPYMHNGAFATLEEVVDFYAGGGGRASGIENVDGFIQGFELTEQEKADLIAFLYALTDESALPSIPDSVPSNLPVVRSLENPARVLAEQYNTGVGGEEAATGTPRTLTVEEGQTIQSVVDVARPGDTVMIPYGVYHEGMVVDLNGITILGIPNEAGEWPVLDGEGRLSEAIISSGSDFEIGYLQALHYTDNGILVEGATGVHIHHVHVEDTGTYGVYPVRSTDVLLENCSVVGAKDAGLYVGQSENIIVRDSVVHDNVAGIEIENSVGAEVYNNRAYDNTVGILVFALPQLNSKVSLNTKVYDNIVENNNTPNFAKEGTTVSVVPAGAGIGLIGADHVEVYGNTITGNKSGGIGIFSLLIAFEVSDVDIGPRPENIYVHDNTFENNGYDPDTFIRELGVPGGDILWDVSGWNVRFDEPEAQAFPPLLPTSQWPDVLYKVYWQVLNFVIGLIG